MTTDKPPRRRRRPSSAGDVPQALVYETWQQKPVYYKGYRDVLAGIKSIDEVMSCSDLQGVLVSLLNGYLFSAINRKVYLISTNEVGIHLAANDNLANDLAIFEKEKVGKLKGKFFDVPPKVVIEVDIKADLVDFLNRENSYIMEKSQKLIDFGVERILWIVTDTRKVYVIDRNDPTWYVVNWSETITVLDDCTLNIAQLLTDESIEF
ncbi:Uma2 family endonuclease [Spirosoma rhododendri]|uniref:Uma2 family endonuclease n=1 Tax=Spirosoma rhododendri TaxID=2728024 RepID=A0A7L5DUU4_9BACT|nr:Uma2 family endonuclease [Spirosoma rhododendri]